MFGKPQSFVYDIADIYKFQTVVPAAFSVAARVAKGSVPVRSAEREVRIACRDMFRKTRLLDQLIPCIHGLLSASGIAVPDEAPEGQEAALPTEVSGDDGHRG